MNLALNEMFSLEESEFWRTFCASQEKGREEKVKHIIFYYIQ